MQQSVSCSVPDERHYAYIVNLPDSDGSEAVDDMLPQHLAVIFARSRADQNTA